MQSVYRNTVVLAYSVPATIKPRQKYLPWNVERLYALDFDETKFIFLTSATSKYAVKEFLFDFHLSHH